MYVRETLTYFVKQEDGVSYNCRATLKIWAGIWSGGMMVKPDYAA